MLVEDEETKGSAASNDEDVASLAERLRAKIRREGFITFHDWMLAALYDEREGYYNRADLARWGRAGDYRTSPERSPLFAATFARYFATLFEELGSPDSFTIIEAGAGAGHFAQGVLASLQHSHARVFAATKYLIDEASMDARARASETLKSFHDRVEFRRLCEIEKPLDAAIIFSNELLDSFPVHRVKMRGGNLCELCVGLDDTGSFTWIEREPTTPRLKSHFKTLNITLDEGQIAEVNLAVEDWLNSISLKFKRGYIITVDYGAEAEDLYHAPHRREGTLRAFSSHHFEDDILVRPGQQDITTTVDWTQIERVGTELGFEIERFERQDQFLLNEGLLEQFERMATGVENQADAAILSTSAREMILPGGMGASFQVLVLKKQLPAK
ncbi:MAG: SAM-dependent methyltransferase [Pyrinomonadaceae bacterium]